MIISLILTHQVAEKITKKPEPPIVVTVPEYKVWCIQNLALPSHGVGLGEEGTLFFESNENQLLLTGMEENMLVVPKSGSIQETLAKKIEITDYQELSPIFFNFESDEITQNKINLDLMADLLNQNSNANVTLWILRTIRDQRASTWDLQEDGPKV